MNQRPITASWQGSQTKQNWITKNPMDLEANRLRPRIVNKEREALYEDVLKQKMSANKLKDENIKLKTQMRMLEGELLRKEKLIDELITKPDAVTGGPVQTNTVPVVGGNFSKMKKLESHLTQNLKRRIKEMQVVIATKTEELEQLKRSMKTTKTQELEAEVRAYQEECTRLRQQLEEVIKSKDTFADPEELKMIEDRFQQQEVVIQGMRQDNNELLMTVKRKDEEMRQLRDFYSDFDKRRKTKAAAGGTGAPAGGSGKELLKAKKQVKDREREIMRLND